LIGCGKKVTDVQKIDSLIEKKSLRPFDYADKVKMSGDQRRKIVWRK